VHSDTFNFILYVDRQPIIVDTGVSTYEKNQLRQTERSTSSHNTVQIEEHEQTEVWGGFRVGNRAKITRVFEGENTIEAVHDGYKKLGYIHKRNFSWDKDSIIIKDDISKSTNNQSKAFFHLHSSIEKPKVFNRSVLLEKENIRLDFEGSKDIILSKHELADGFNKTKPAFKITVTFDKYLQSKISL
jgi:uncharacterized heparinase superfamily protein